MAVQMQPAAKHSNSCARPTLLSVAFHTMGLQHWPLSAAAARTSVTVVCSP
jgi:hypothetical protein